MQICSTYYGDPKIQNPNRRSKFQVRSSERRSIEPILNSQQSSRVLARTLLWILNFDLILILDSQFIFLFTQLWAVADVACRAGWWNWAHTVPPPVPGIRIPHYNQESNFDCPRERLPNCPKQRRGHHYRRRHRYCACQMVSLSLELSSIHEIDSTVLVTAE